MRDSLAHCQGQPALLHTCTLLYLPSVRDIGARWKFVSRSIMSVVSSSYDSPSCLGNCAPGPRPSTACGPMVHNPRVRERVIVVVRLAVRFSTEALPQVLSVLFFSTFIRNALPISSNHGASYDSYQNLISLIMGLETNFHLGPMIPTCYRAFAGP